MQTYHSLLRVMEFNNISNILYICLTLYAIDLLYTIDYIYSHTWIKAIPGPIFVSIILLANKSD